MAMGCEAKMRNTRCILKHKIFYFTIKNISRISTINQTHHCIISFDWEQFFESNYPFFDYLTDLKAIP